MLREIRDCKNRCACYVDDVSGYVVHEYRRVRTESKVGIGEEYTIIRDNTVTVLKRSANKGFAVKKIKL